MSECNESEINLCRFRGDTYPAKFRATNEGSPQVLDITSYAFLMTVNSVKSPDANSSPIVGDQKFQITGTITDAATGRFEFQYTGSPAPQLLDPGTYYYDVQMTDGTGDIRTIIKGKYTIKQDITK
jgi:hypothetical protein